jgi:hypothetical protein
MYSTIFFLFFVFFISSFNTNIQLAEGQKNMDSFTAKGSLFSKMSQTPLLDNENRSINESMLNPLLNNSSSSSQSSNITDNMFVLEGGWELVVKKGEVSLFRSILTLSKDNKIVNVFGIENLTNNRYIQINSQGSEIISGTVDFLSVGLKNATLSNVNAIITIKGITQLRISLDNSIVGEYINKQLIGHTRIFADGNGNILLGPKPASPLPPPTQNIPPPSQPNSLNKNNQLF